MNELGSQLLNGDLGLWIGLIFSLAIFSAIAGDHLIARLAQHILVGVTLGYSALMAIRAVLQPRLFARLADEAVSGQWLLVPLVLGLFLLVAGLDAIRAPAIAPEQRGRTLLRTLGILPVALLLGVGLSVALLGVIQGTLAPQFWQAVGVANANADTVLEWSLVPIGVFLTSATLLAVTLTPAQAKASWPRPIRLLVRGWIWIGQRALWLAAGVILTRLIAARLSLLIGRYEYVIETLRSIGLWP